MVRRRAPRVARGFVRRWTAFAVEDLAARGVDSASGSDMRGWEDGDAEPSGRATRSPAARKRLVELKARIRSSDQLSARLRALGATHRATLDQRDVYFRVAEGRLKLRHQRPGRDQLVFYRRPDVRDAKESDVLLHAVGDALGLEELLSAALGVDRVVVKKREVFEWHGTRVHVDRVEGLGEFLEFERDVGTDEPAAARERLRSLLGELGVSRSELEDGSYADLLRAHGGT